MAIQMDGKRISKELKEHLSIETDRYLLEYGRPPLLVTLLVGNEPASLMYVQMKKKACEEAGILNQIFAYETISEEEIISLINRWNKTEEIDGILIQHPLPEGIDEATCFRAIAPDKDIDGLSERSSFKSATANAMMNMLDYYGIDVEGKNAVVVGRSTIVGKPTANLLLERNATVTICHSKTKNIKDYLKKADIVVAAIGKPHFIKSEWLKENVVVIDVGYNEGNIGDVDPKGLNEKASYYSPVPGGVGPVTIATLLEQTLEAYKNHVEKTEQRQKRR